MSDVSTDSTSLTTEELRSFESTYYALLDEEWEKCVSRWKNKTHIPNIKVVKPDRSPSSILYDSTSGVHLVYPTLFQKYAASIS